MCAYVCMQQPVRLCKCCPCMHGCMHVYVMFLYMSCSCTWLHTCICLFLCVCVSYIICVCNNPLPAYLSLWQSIGMACAVCGVRSENYVSSSQRLFAAYLSACMCSPVSLWHQQWHCIVAMQLLLLYVMRAPDRLPATPPLSVLCASGCCQLPSAHSASAFRRHVAVDTSILLPHACKCL